MRRYFLAPDVYWCKTSDGIVFLNLRRDRYIGLALNDVPKLNAIIADWPSASPLSTSVGTTADAELTVTAESLISAGLLTVTPQKTHPMPVSIEIGSEVLPNADFDHRPTLHLNHVINFLYASVRSALSLKYQSIHRVVKRVRSRKTRAESNCRASGKAQRQDQRPEQACMSLERVRALTMIYRLLRVFSFTARDACLLDSLALVEFLARYQIFPDWVFGVRTGLFAAHSWVQHGPYVLNGSVELARTYTPILVV